MDQRMQRELLEAFYSPWITPIDSETEWFIKNGLKTTFNSNEIIYEQGDFCDSVFYVRSGRVKIIIQEENGFEIVLGIHEADTVFGEPSAVDGGRCFASAVALTKTEVYQIRFANLCDLIQSNPQIAPYLFRSLTRKIRNLVEHVNNFAFREAPTRVTRLLKHLINNSKMTGDKITLRLTHQEIAEMTGLNRVTVTNTLGILKKKGIIDITRGTIIVLDKDKLING